MFIKRLLIALLLLLPTNSYAADSTVTALTAASALNGTELFYCVQSGADRKCTGAQAGTYILTSPVLTGTPTIPTPFTLGATSVTSTGTQLNYLNGATGTTGTASTNIVFSTSPTLITPALGTPSALVLTNATGAPSAITLTNGTGLPIAGITGLGTGIGTWLATPSSANLATAIIDETGSGALVFGTSPTLVSPALGAATATTINGVTLDTNAWSITTPTPTPGGGSFTATSIVHAKVIGKTNFASILVTITSAGTGTGAVSVAIPWTQNASVGCILVGRDTGLTGAALIANIAPGATNTTITFATGLTAIAVTNLTVSGVCEAN